MAMRLGVSICGAYREVPRIMAGFVVVDELLNLLRGRV
jgi:hypothetical protein